MRTTYRYSCTVQYYIAATTVLYYSTVQLYRYSCTGRAIVPVLDR
eukprot:COSAG01_NODE_53941_length_335_cov_1.779661_2_plen_44_part_01